jgi:hypothetical protein
MNDVACCFVGYPAVGVGNDQVKDPLARAGSSGTGLLTEYHLGPLRKLRDGGAR